MTHYVMDAAICDRLKGLAREGHTAAHDPSANIVTLRSMLDIVSAMLGEVAQSGLTCKDEPKKGGYVNFMLGRFR